jgi:hypothetical protein
VKSLSLSVTNFLRMPWILKHLSIIVIATCSTVNVFLYGMKCAYFVNRSTTTSMPLYVCPEAGSSEYGRSVIKSIVTSCYSCSGGGENCMVLYFACRDALFF